MSNIQWLVWSLSDYNVCWVLLSVIFKNNSLWLHKMSRAKFFREVTVKEWTSYVATVLYIVTVLRYASKSLAIYYLLIDTFNLRSFPHYKAKTFRRWSSLEGPCWSREGTRTITMAKQHLPHHLSILSLPTLLGVQQETSSIYRQVRSTPFLVGPFGPSRRTWQTLPIALACHWQQAVANSYKG